ncbi:MAG: phosphoribosylformylglycinamidine cyclo-ligase, partial [gamma proteobacterium symbiont of Ctena orbiculata]
GCKAIVDSDSWRLPALFSWLQTQGNLINSEMLRTFNCGVGMVVCVAPEDAERTVKLLNESGETAWRLGEIASADGAEASVEITGPLA